MGEVHAKQDDEDADILPDTASPCESVLSGLRIGWGRLLPINCSLNAKELTEDDYSIGREPRCAVSITKYDVKPELFKQISKVQCRISRSKVNDEEYVVFLEDLSSNGTFVNRQKVGKGEKMIISSDDEISFAVPDFKVFLYVDSKVSSQWMPPSLSCKYHIIKHLGAGGFAEVKLVLDKKSCSKLAMKKLSKAGIAEDKIINEVCILGRLRHPENILLHVKRGGLVVAKIADFGLAKVKDSMTRLKTACGTLNYTAPEVLSCRGEQEYTSKVDMWGLGAVLYTCLSGRRPFADKPGMPGLLIAKILRGQYSLSTPEWKCISTPAKLFIKHLLVVDPNMRYDSTVVFKDKWLKDPVMMNDFCTLFGSMSPFVDENPEPPTKMLRRENVIA